MLYEIFVALVKAGIQAMPRAARPITIRIIM
jgi:hypothetical protein